MLLNKINGTGIKHNMQLVVHNFNLFNHYLQNNKYQNHLNQMNPPIAYFQIQPKDAMLAEIQTDATEIKPTCYDGQSESNNYTVNIHLLIPQHLTPNTNKPCRYTTPQSLQRHNLPSTNSGLLQQPRTGGKRP